MTMGLVHAARQIEAQGRGPDTSLAHISPDESAMLDYMQGGRRMNPVTGLAEYGLFGKILKAVAKIGASTAGFMYGGPLGAAAASAAVSKLTGDSWKSALTTGAISGVTAGIGSYASGARGLTGANSLLQSGNTLAANAAAASAAAAPSMSAIAPNFAPLAGEGSNTIAEAVKAGTMNAIGTPAVSFAPLAGVGSNTVQEAAKAGTILAAPAAATGLSGLGTKILPTS
jgi:hypothetical protein